MTTVTYPNDYNTKVNLTSIELQHDDEHGYYLSVRYRIEDDSHIEDVYIPKVSLPINKHRVSVSFLDDGHRFCDIGFGLREIFKTDNGLCIYTRIIEEKTHEMTLDEIEKKLGYKVKIVNSK